MKKFFARIGLVYILTAIVFGIGIQLPNPSQVFAGQQLVNLPLASNLTDTKGNLTAGGLIRNSDATYVNTSGALAYSRGTRTNLLTYSGTFTNAIWVNGAGVLVTEETGVSTPTGLQAYRLNRIATGYTFVRREVIAGAIGNTYTFSIHVKKGNWRYVGIRNSVNIAGNDHDVFDLDTLEFINITSQQTYGYESIGDGWYRIYSTHTQDAAAPYFGIALSDNLGAELNPSGISNGSYILIAGAQLEALPSGNVIGSDLMDQEQLNATELVTNGTFAADSDWTKGAGWTISGGAANANVSSWATLDQAQTNSLNSYLKVTFDITVTSGSVLLYFGAGINQSVTTSGSKTLYFFNDRGSNQRLYIGSAAFVGSIDNISVKEVTAPAKGQFHDVAMLAGSTELVTNGGFETITDAGPPVNFGTWTETRAGGDTITDPGAGYLGSHSAAFTYVNNGNSYAYQDIVTVAGKLYKLEYYTKGDGTVGGRYQVRDNIGAANIVALTDTGITGTTYTKLTKYFVAPTGCTSARILFWVPSSAGTVYFDYVSVRQVQTAWTRYGTNTMEIDPTEGSGGALKVTYVDNSSGAYLTLRDTWDNTSDLTLGETYQITFKSKVSSSGSVLVGISAVGTNINTTITGTTLASYTLYFKCDSITLNAVKLGFSDFNAGESIWIDDLTIKAVPDLAYLSPGTYAATSGTTATIPAEPRFEANGLLVEGEATNIWNYSYVLQSGGYSELTPTDNVTTDPFGNTNSAGKAIPSSANTGSHVVRQLTTILAPGSWTATFFAKPFGYNLVGFREATGTGAYAVFNVSTGVVVDSGSLGAGGATSITPIGSSGWYRCRVSFTVSVAYSCTLNVHVINNSYVSGSPHSYLYQGNGTDGTYLWGIQLEATAYPTSYIPTNGCPVTRLSEAGSATNGYSWTMSTELKNSLGAASPSKGTLLVDFMQPMTEGTSAVVRGLVTATDNAVNLLFMNATTPISLRSYAGTNAAYIQPASIASQTTYTFALRWDSTARYLQISEKHSGTWDVTVDANERKAYDGAFTLGTYLRLGYGNEYPFWIKNIRFADYWIPDSLLDVGGYGAKGYMQTGMGTSLH